MLTKPNNFSNTAFFRENPLFGVRFLAEILISVAAALFGFSTVPTLAKRVVHWFEHITQNAISNVVNDFWSQQSHRMQESRREKQKAEKINREKKAKDQLQNKVLLDTSVLIDGRVLGIVKAGFLDKFFIVPQSVMAELHLLADNEDDLKRQRGRRGLSVLEALKKSSKVMLFNGGQGGGGADADLVQLAKKFKMKLMTIDFNLNKVAKIEDVQVLNINELVEVVKSNLVPGDTMMVKVVHEGKERGQGVGYLEDGTMLVVEGAQKMVGLNLNVKVSKVIQSPAGKIIFCVQGSS